MEEAVRVVVVCVCSISSLAYMLVALFFAAASVGCGQIGNRCQGFGETKDNPRDRQPRVNRDFESRDDAKRFFSS